MSALDCIRCFFTRKDLPERDIYRIIEQGNGSCRIEVRYYMVVSPTWCQHTCEWHEVYGNYASRDVALRAVKDKIDLLEGNKVKEIYTEEDLGL